jgi:hypothetical protein
MDAFGLEHLDEYPDWVRSGNSLELRNREKRKRFFVSHRRCFFDAICQSPTSGSPETAEASRLFSDFADRMKITRIERLGLRIWAAFPKNYSFEKLVQKTSRKLNSNSRELLDCLDSEVVDSAFAVDLKTHDGWGMNLRSGPMKKSQWFNVVPHEMQLFRSDADAMDYQAKFSDVVFYLEIDHFKEDFPYSEARDLCERMRCKFQTLATKLNDYLEL